MIKLCNVV